MFSYCSDRNYYEVNSYLIVISNNPLARHNKENSLSTSSKSEPPDKNINFNKSGAFFRYSMDAISCYIGGLS